METNSGTIGSNRVLLSGLGLDMDKDFKLMHAAIRQQLTRLLMAKSLRGSHLVHQLAPLLS